MAAPAIVASFLSQPHHLFLGLCSVAADRSAYESRQSWAHLCRPGTLRISLLCHAFPLVCLCPIKLIAEDADSQPNGQIAFSIVSGDRDNEFAVDPVLGLVKVKKKLDRERVS